MSLTPEHIAFIEELFAPLGGITHRKMMGGLSIYHDGQIFAALDDEGTLYLKATAAFADTLKAEGSHQFVPGSTGNPMGYWTMPSAALDDPELACDWARRTLAAL